MKELEELEIVKKPVKKKTKKKKKVKNLRLTERDFEVLKFTLEMGCVSADVIWIGFYKENEIGKKYVQNRLSRFRRGDYLVSHFTPDGASRWYTPTKKTHSMVKSYFDLEDSELPEPRKNIAQVNFYHDKGMCLIRAMMLSKGHGDNWKSDYYLREVEALLNPKASDKELRSVPDGVYENAQGLRVAIEFERTKKSRFNIIRKLEASMEDSKSDCVLFIFTDERIKSAYETILKDFKAGYLRKALAFIAYDDLIKLYEKDFNDFSLRKYIPDFFIKKINGQLEYMKCFFSSQERLREFFDEFKNENFLRRDNALDYRDKLESEERERLEAIEKEKELIEYARRYRAARGEYLKWKKLPLAKRLITSQPKKPSVNEDIDEADDLLGWWQ